jgi:hypothetical protein
MLHAEQHKIRTEYEQKFRELERERMQVQDKRAQVRTLPSCDHGTEGADFLSMFFVRS